MRDTFVDSAEIFQELMMNHGLFDIFADKAEMDRIVC